MAGSQVATSVTVLSVGLKGYQAISLTNFTTSAESAIAAGSTVEIAGAWFQFSSDEAINATSWTTVSTGQTAYLVAIPAGSAGSQTVTVEYTPTAPAWVDAKNGFYASAASASRVIGGMYKNSATSYQHKWLYDALSGNAIKRYATHGASVSRDYVAEVCGGLATGLTYLSKANSFAFMAPHVTATDETVLLSGVLIHELGYVWHPMKATRASAASIIVQYVQEYHISSGTPELLYGEYTLLNVGGTDQIFGMSVGAGAITGKMWIL
jgi:hypothetical protein